MLRHAVRNIDRSLLSRLIRHALDLPVSFHLRNSAVETLSRIEELRHLRRFLTNAVVFVFVDILFVFLFLGLMLNFSPALALIVLASLPLYVAPAFVMMPALRRKRRRTRTTRRDGNEAVLDTFNGIDTVKGMHAEHPQEGFLVRRLDDAISAEEDSEDLRASMTQYNQFVNRLAIAGLLWFGASMVLDGQLTLGQLVAINILNMRFSQPMMRLCMFVYDFSQLRAIVKEVGEILNAPSERAAGPFIRLAELKGAIRFEEVRFRYPGSDRDALDGVTLEIAPGETVGLVGSSGSGKSTLVRLVQKLHVATEGRLLLDGMDAGMFDPAWLRGHIGAVEQDYPIFRRTVAENIALGPAERDMARVIDAARTACAHEFIAGLPDGYATRIGARGVHLSGGERQRIALARALFHAKRILVLDEATSSLDHECERRVQESVRRAIEGRTAIIVAHRLSALRHVDRIVSLDRGRIVEQGTPAELALRDGYFSRMVLEEPVLAGGFVTGPAAADVALPQVAGGAGEPVMATSSVRPQLLLMALLAAFLVTTVIWASVAEVEIAAAAPGRIVPVGLVKTVKPFQQGKMKRIAVEEGSVVDAGDVLIELDTTLVDADLAKLTAELAIKSVEAARLEALLGWRRRAPFNPPERRALRDRRHQRAARRRPDRIAPCPPPRAGRADRGTPGADRNAGGERGEAREAAADPARADRDAGCPVPHEAWLPDQAARRAAEADRARGRHTPREQRDRRGQGFPRSASRPEETHGRRVRQGTAGRARRRAGADDPAAPGHPPGARAPGAAYARLSRRRGRAGPRRAYPGRRGRAGDADHGDRSARHGSQGGGVRVERRRGVRQARATGDAEDRDLRLPQIRHHRGNGDERGAGCGQCRRTRRGRGGRELLRPARAPGADRKRAGRTGIPDTDRSGSHPPGDRERDDRPVARHGGGGRHRAGPAAGHRVRPAPL